MLAGDWKLVTRDSLLDKPDRWTSPFVVATVRLHTTITQPDDLKAACVHFWRTVGSQGLALEAFQLKVLMPQS